MILPPPRAVGVSDSGAAVAFLMRSRAARAALTLAGGEVLTPSPHAQGGQGEGRAGVVEGDRAYNLTLVQLGHSQPHGVSSCVCHDHWCSTSPLRT